MSEEPHPHIKQFRNRVEKYTVPEQVKVLENLSVKSLDQKTSRMLAEEIDKAFTKDEIPQRPHTLQNQEKDKHLFSTYFSLHMATQLYYQNPTSIIKEIKITEDGNETIYLGMSKMLDNKIRRVELFEIPSEDDKRIPNKPYTNSFHDAIRRPTINFATYKHILVTNMESGLTADLLDLLPDGKTSQYHLNIQREFKPNILRTSYADKNKIVLIPNDKSVHENKDDDRTLTYPHETGHMVDSTTRNRDENLIERLDNLATQTTESISRIKAIFTGKRSPFDMTSPESSRKKARSVVQERNAWAFALAVVRRYKNLGIDIAPDFSKSELIETANNALRSYQESDEFQYSKTKSTS